MLQHKTILPVEGHSTDDAPALIAFKKSRDAKIQALKSYLLYYR